VVAAWLILQLTDVLSELMELESDVGKIVIILLVVGFIPALVFAWAFELTPQGIKRETAVDPGESITRHTGRKLDFAIIGLLAIALIFVVVDNYVLEAEPEQAVVTTDSIPAAEPFAREKSIRSLAVLPLENLSGDPDQEYFSDGMTDALIAELGKIRALRVISRQSVMRYKGTDKSMPQIAQELGVGAVIEGSVLHSEGRVRITAQLIGTGPERHLWANNYDRDLSDILILLSEVARAIAGEIQVTLTPEEETRLGSTRPVNPEAHEAYLKGRYIWDQFTREGWNRALDYHKEAIANDPGFALPYVGLAEAYNLSGSWYGDRPPQEAHRLARAAAEKALEIDDTLAEAHTELGFAQFIYAWDWAGAEREFRRGIQLDPNSARARGKYAVFLHAMGRFEEAKLEINRALELNPLSPIAYADLGMGYFHSGQYGKAREQALKAAELDPDFPPTYEVLGQAFWREGMPEKAIDAFRKAVQLSNENPDQVGDLGYAYAVSGRTEEARNLLRKLKRLQSKGHVAVAIAKVHAGLGEKDLAFASLEGAIEEGNPSVVFLNVDWALDSLRSDPRFAEFLRRMNFPGS
jgi:TolB-like protein/Flp pilus assembly protein TadD